MQVPFSDISSSPCGQLGVIFNLLIQMDGWEHGEKASTEEWVPLHPSQTWVP